MGEVSIVQFQLNPGHTILQQEKLLPDVHGSVATRPCGVASQDANQCQLCARRDHSIQRFGPLGFVRFVLVVPHFAHQTIEALRGIH